MQAIELITTVTEQGRLELLLPDQVPKGKVKVLVLYEDQPSNRPRSFGQFSGQGWIADDFDSPLDAESWLGEQA